MPNIFQASTGYRDPNKALTLKALEARSKAASDAMATAMQPQVVSDPMQGIAGIADVLGASMRQGRVDRAEATGRADLANIMAGVNMDSGPDMNQIAQIGVRDPELAKAMYEAAMRQRQEIADREDKQKFEHGESDLTRQAEMERLLKQQELTRSENSLQRGSTEGIAGADRTATATQKGLDRTQQTTLQDDQQQANTDSAAKLAVTNADQAKADAAAQLAKQDAAAKDAVNLAGVNSGLNVKENEAKVNYEGATEPGKIWNDWRHGAYGNPDTPEAQAQRDNFLAVEGRKNMVKPADMFSPAQAQVEQAMGKDVADWKISGGPNATKAIQQVSHALDLLRTKPNITGFMAGASADFAPDLFNKWWNPDGTIAQSAIRESISQTLRATLGAQFTEKEGTQLMDRAFDIKLGQEENIRRASLLMQQIQTIAKNREGMAEHLRKNGNFLNYTGDTAGQALLMELLDTDYGTGSAGAGTGTGTGTGGIDIDALVDEANKAP